MGRRAKMKKINVKFMAKTYKTKTAVMEMADRLLNEPGGPLLWISVGSNKIS